jgi:5-formyltetrahydrofolate cyclo-ligase
MGKARSRRSRPASTKDRIRARVWLTLERRGLARFPMPIRDRIPNFAGAEAAAARAAELPEWRAATCIKCNPDAPQRPLRRRALEDGKVVFMAVPRLTTERCFLRLAPEALAGKLAQAATIKGASALGEPILPGELPTIDLVVAGSVAVNGRGARVGKGGGYSDLEFALARELGRVGEDTPVLTTVHDEQIVRGDIPMTDHDVPVDLIATPRRVVRVVRAYPKPAGIDWRLLSEAQLDAMPPLRQRKSASSTVRARPERPRPAQPKRNAGRR